LTIGGKVLWIGNSPKGDGLRGFVAIEKHDSARSACIAKHRLLTIENIHSDPPQVVDEGALN
jgi:hypothetical protein